MERVEGGLARGMTVESDRAPIVVVMPVGWVGFISRISDIVTGDNIRCAWATSVSCYRLSPRSLLHAR